MSKSLPELRTENKKLKRTLKVWRGIAERNMEDANAALNQYAEGMQRSKFASEMHKPLETMVNDAKTKRATEQKRICNEHGVYRAFTQDTLYTQLDEQSLRSIAQDKVDLNALNHILLVRNQIKESMKHQSIQL